MDDRAPSSPASDVSVTTDSEGLRQAYDLVAKAPSSAHVPDDSTREWPVQGILKALLDFAPSEEGRRYVGGSILRVVEASGGPESEGVGAALAQFAGHWIGTVLIPLKANASKTPSPSHNPSRSGEYIDRIDEYVQSATRGSQTALRKMDFRDPVSGEYDITIRGSPALRAAAIASSPQGRIRDIYTLVACHIIPFALNNFGSRPEERNSKAVVWGCIRGFYPEARLPRQLAGELINAPQNAILLSSQYHAPFGAFDITFEPQSDGFYVLWMYGLDGDVEKISGISFRGTGAGSEKIPQPDPRLLRLHFSIARVLHASGAGRIIDEILRDVDSTPVLAEDGSMARLLHTALTVRLKA